MSIRQFFRNRGSRAQSGDTIVEVVLALTVLGLVLSAASVTANRNSRTLQDTQERNFALRLSQGQLERIKADIRLSVGAAFCVNSSGEVRAATHNDCQRVEGGATYTQSIMIQGVSATDGYEAKATTSWESLLGYQSSVEQTYRFYAVDLPGTPQVQGASHDIQRATRGGSSGGGGSDNSSTIVGAGSCPAGMVGTYPNNCYTPCPPGWGGKPPNCTPPPCPAGYTGPGQPNCTERKRLAISHYSVAYPTWHLAASQSLPGRTHTFTVTLPAGSAPVTISSTTISNPNNFRVVSNSCANKTLNAGGSCTITVEYKPVGAAAANRLNSASAHPDHGTSYKREGTLTINSNANGAAPIAYLVGYAYSNVMLPGDVMFMGSLIKSYDPGCYNNADACGWTLIMQGDANWVLYEPQAQGGRARWFTGQQPTGTWAQMQGNDGHIVEYRETWPGSRGQPGGSTVVWAPHNTNRSAGDYLALHNSGHLETYSSTGAHKLYIFVP